MTNDRPMNTARPSWVVDEIRQHAALLGPPRTVVIEEILSSLLKLQELDPDKLDPATGQQEFELLLTAFATIAGPRLPELVAYMAEHMGGPYPTDRPNRDE